MLGKIAIAALIAPFSAGYSAAAVAQTQPAPKSVCLTDSGFRAFDFWLGEWDVTVRKGGKFAGTNSITSIESGCALLEQRKGASGSTGMSTNHYNPVTKKWRQLWLSAGAYEIDIQGGLKGGSMALEGTIVYYATGKSFDFNGTWTPEDGGTVRQHFKQYDPAKKEWVTWFDATYTPSAKKMVSE
ncbi:MAG: hypothetical protein COB37_08315 [Kordiimonadales bacterium]|nr:MAG: hypothetical protein COB37_08315 [Kordiimonadales bacterium]